MQSPTLAKRFDRLVITAIALLGLLTMAVRAKPKTKEVPGPDLPEDLNLASLRVHAIDTIYELDLSPAQLKQLSAAATNCASDRKRAPAQGNEKLTAAFTDLNRALLNHQDDQEIARLRNHLTELATADDVHLDDEVTPTQTALVKSPEVSRKFSAGQIAAYLASHADQITDPAEKMLSDLTELRDKGNDAQAQDLIKESSEEIAQLVTGADTKAASVALKVTQWFKSNSSLTDDQLVARHDQLETSAQAVIGDVPPMDVLSHWFDNETAVLLSNPQLPQAIAAVLAAQEK